MDYLEDSSIFALTISFIDPIGLRHLLQSISLKLLV